MEASRLDEEREFFDRQYGEQNRLHIERFYVVATRPYIENVRELSQGVAGKAVLEYGCGDTPDLGIELAAAEANVRAFDLSPVAIERARALARDRGAEIDFQVMNGEKLEYGDDEFDIVCGHGVIHHLDLSKALPEIARVLKPGGVASFVEPWGHNAVINWYRNRTNDFRTTDEHPLVRSDIEIAKRSFGRVEITHSNLMTLPAIPLTMTRRFGDGSRIFGRTLSALEKLDDFVCSRSRALGNWGWTVRLMLRDPA
jgi:SAM-dependent methyltransferase